MAHNKLSGTFPAEGYSNKKRYCDSGEFRAPRIGEFYLSGADPAALRAPSDFSTPYRIAVECDPITGKPIPAPKEQESTITIDQFIASNGITMTTTRIHKRTDNASEWGNAARHWECTLTREDRTMRVEFIQGSAHTVSPAVDDVLDSLTMDVSCVIDSTFEQFCAELGYDNDSRKAERVYFACRDTARKLREFLPSGALDTLLYNTERL